MHFLKLKVNVGHRLDFELEDNKRLLYYIYLDIVNKS